MDTENSNAMVKVRSASLDDADAITEIYSHHVLHGIATFEEIAPDVDDMAGRMSKVIERGLPWLVAEKDGKVLGYAYAGPFHLRSAYRFTVEDSIYLAPSAFGRGVGSLLLAELIERCRKAGMIQMMAVIGDSQNMGSISLHRKFGFSDMGIARNIGFKFGKWVDVVYMQLELQSPGIVAQVT